MTYNVEKQPRDSRQNGVRWLYKGLNLSLCFGIPFMSVWISTRPVLFPKLKKNCMKKILCLFLIFPLVSFSQAGKGTIKGVVKYYLSEDHLHKADFGSKVYVLDSQYAGNFNIQLADTFKTCLM